jgi:hypothetical protein
MESFIKILPCRVVCAQVGLSSSGEVNPLLFTHYLEGEVNENSVVRFLIAAIMSLD